MLSSSSGTSIPRPILAKEERKEGRKKQRRRKKERGLFSVIALRSWRALKIRFNSGLIKNALTFKWQFYEFNFQWKTFSLWFILIFLTMMLFPCLYLVLTGIYWSHLLQKIVFGLKIDCPNITRMDTGFIQPYFMMIKWFGYFFWHITWLCAYKHQDFNVLNQPFLMLWEMVNDKTFLCKKAGWAWYHKNTINSI